jgi:transposase
MAMRRTSVKKIREIMRLRDECGISQRQIARALKISRPVVAQYIIDMKSAGLHYSHIKDMPDDELLEILESDKRVKNTKYDKISEKFDYYVKELKKTGVTLETLWEEYREGNPDGYSYSRFCYHYQVWRNSSQISMHIEHKAGDKLFVDFAGKKLKITDRHTGNQKEVETFIAVLGASQMTYVEATMSQKKEDWIMANRNALHYIGGVPRAIVSDCLKTAITESNWYEPEINPEYADFARHYGTAILPARPAKPKDKALVEGAVRIVYAWIYARLRNRIFYSIEELNKAINEELERYNGNPMQKIKKSRRELFEEIEKSELAPLPVQQYELRKYEKRTPAFNYHVYLKADKHYYSIPYRYRRNEVDVFYTERVVEIFHRNIRIAIHERDRRENKYTTLPDHMPPNHRWMNDWNPEKLEKWAENIGPAVKDMVKAVLGSRQHPEQAYRSCLGILSLAKKYGEQRLNNACMRALYFNHYSYKGVNNILKNRLDGIQEETLFSQLPEHENIRGNKYYDYQGKNNESGYN